MRCPGPRTPASATRGRPGRALARLHVAAERFPLPSRAPAVLTSGCEIILAADPLAEVKWLAGRARLGLSAYLDGRAWPDDLTGQVLPAIRRAAPLLAGLPRQWGHGRTGTRPT